MIDTVTFGQRSIVMSKIGSKDTKPEKIIRKELHARGYRYRLHQKELPGKPDLVLSRYHTVIFVNGCFWHGHNCDLFRWPKTRAEFWFKKINENIARDKKNEVLLIEKGWRVFVVWECSIRPFSERKLASVADFFEEWLHSDQPRGEPPNV